MPVLHTLEGGVFFFKNLHDTAKFFYSLLLYISRYHFLKLFVSAFKISEKKIFVTTFPFPMDSLKPPPT